MNEYKSNKILTFSWNETYKLNNNSRLKKFKYNIILGEPKVKRDNFVLIYYDLDQDEVLYREINELVFYVLKALKQNKTIAKILKSICKENDINFS